MSDHLQPLDFTDLEGWQDDNHLAAFHAFRVSARRMVDVPYKTRALGIDADNLLAVARQALKVSCADSWQARTFFETHFQPARLTPDDGSSTGFVTGYYEPEVKASRTQSADYPVALLKRPPELVEIGDADRPRTMDSSFRFARKMETGLEEFFSRREIQNGALDGRDLELVWLPNKIDAFFIHVQGSARLVLEEGGVMRVTYAAKSGHPYTSLGKQLCQRLNVAQSVMTMDYLRGWMENNPDELDDFLAQNDSYIFFEEVLDLDPASGPIAAAKVPLIEGRSLAVDRTLHTFGSPVWVATQKPLPGDNHPHRSLMIAHDTGSAIVGTARGDIFVGTGNEAGLIAGKIQHDADMVVFVPRTDILS